MDLDLKTPIDVSYYETVIHEWIPVHWGSQILLQGQQELHFMYDDVSYVKGINSYDDVRADRMTYIRV